MTVVLFTLVWFFYLSGVLGTICYIGKTENFYDPDPTYFVVIFSILWPFFLFGGVVYRTFLVCSGR